MKRTGIILKLIMALLASAVAGTLLFDLATANPLIHGGDVPPDSKTYPPKISISSPENNTAYAVNRLSLVFNVTAPKSETAHFTAIYEVSYDADWMENPLVIFDEGYNFYKERLAFSFQLSGIPEGKHSILIQVIGFGTYINYGTGFSSIPAGIPISNPFYINSSSLISFTIDTTAPIVSVLSVENKTYATRDVAIDFTVDEPVSFVTCNIDGQIKVLTKGNATLTDLAEGEHNLTIFARDNAGNVGNSETIHFTITEETEQEPFPTTYSMGIVALIIVALLGSIVYILKCKRG